MKNFLLILTSTLALSCTNYSAGDLNGKWTHPTEPQELWISDTLAIAFNFEEQFLILMDVEYGGNILTFTYIFPYAHSTYSDKIIDLTSDQLELELQNPGNPERRKYQRSTTELPDISTDYETNYQRYEALLKSKINSR